jgi:parallel beta-helix repeat protein
MPTTLRSFFGMALIMAMAMVNAQAQPTIISTQPTFTSNNGSGATTFNFQNSNPYPIVITDVSTVINLSGTPFQVTLWVNPIPVSGAPSTIANFPSTGWVAAATSTVTSSIGSASNNVAEPVLSNISVTIPANTTVGMAVACFSGTIGRMRYFTIPSGNPTFTGGGVTIISGNLIGYGYTSTTANPINLRGFVGSITFKPGITGPNDAGISEIISPVNNCPNSNLPVVARLINSGTNQLQNATINWTVNGLAQTPFVFVGLLDTAGGTGSTDTTLTIGTYTFGSSRDTIIAWTTAPNGVLDTINSNDTATRVVSAALSGIYTIGGSGSNFPNLIAFSNAISQGGVCGPVVVNIDSTSGPYTGQVVFNNVIGSSTLNTVTINGNGAVVQATPTTTDISVIRLSNTRHFSLNRLNVVSLATTTGTGILLTNDANFNTIQNCVIDISANTSLVTTSAGIAFSGSISSVITAGNSGSFDTIRNNVIRGAAGGGPYYGITMYGSSATAGCLGNVVENNQIIDFGFYGILLTNASNNTIFGNNIHKPNRTNFTTFGGVTLQTAGNNNRIERNRIHNPCGGNLASISTLYGLFVSSCDAPVGSENIFANNLIYNMNGNGTIYGIYNAGSDGTQFFHNTVSLDFAAATAGITRGFFQTTAASNISFRNNIVTISRGGSGVKHAVYFGTTTSTITCNNNAYWVNSTGSGAQHIGFYSADATTLAAWQAVNAGAYDQNSVNNNPIYANPATFSLIPTSGAVNNIGTQISQVPTDFLGQSRGASPDPGAYEFNPSNDDAGVTQITPLSFCPGSVLLSARIKNFGILPLTSVNVTIQVNGNPVGTVSFNGNLAGGVDTLINVGSFNFLSTATYNLVAYTSLPNGSPDGFTANDTLTRSNLTTSLAGTYSVGGTGSNFPSMIALANAISSAGVCGPVIVNLDSASGPYIGQVVFNNIVGTSSTNTVTINGNGAVVQATPTTTDISVLRLSNSSYFTLNRINVVNQATTTGTGILLTAGSNFNTIQNCVIDISANTSLTTGSAGIALSGGITSTITTGNSGSFDTIRNNVIRGAAGGGPYYGITMYGSSATAGCLGNVVENNEIVDFGFYGILLTNASNNTIFGNNIHKPNRTNFTTFGGVTLQTAGNNNRIERNRIHNPCGGNLTSTSTLYGLFVSSCDAPLGGENIFANNLIYNMNGIGTIYGVYNIGSDGASFFHNTVSLDFTPATGGITRGFFQTTAANNISFQNNIITVRRGGSGVKHAVYFGTATSTIICNNNAYWVNSTGSGAQHIGFYTADATTLAAWQAVNAGAYDQNSVNGDPVYANPAGFVLIPTSGITNNIGTPLTQVTTDFLGQTRGANPDPGAYEFSPIGTDLALISVGGFSNRSCSANLSISAFAKFVNSGASSLTGFSISMVISGTSGSNQQQVYSGTLNSSATDSVVFNPLVGLQPGLYTWTVFVSASGDGNLLNDTLTGAFEIILTQSNPTIITPNQVVCAGSSALLVANGNQNISWFSNPGLTTRLGEGDSIQLGPITTNTTYYVANDIGVSGGLGLTNRVGSTTNSGYSDVGLMFTALQPFTLNSVAVYPVASAPSGNCTFTVALRNSAGTTLQSATFSVPTSVSPGIKTPITLNFQVPVGVGHRLVFTSASGGGLSGFIRETSTGFSYPYTFPGIASLTSAYTGGPSATFYYYFYDWQFSSGSGCPGRDSVQVQVGNTLPSPDFNFTVNQSTVSFSNLSNSGATYSWNFGDGVGTSTAVNPVYNYTTTGSFNVILNASNACGGPVNTSKTVTISVLGGLDDNLDTSGEALVYPNPANDLLFVQFDKQSSGVISLMDLNGKLIKKEMVKENGKKIAFDLSGLSSGMYILHIDQADQRVTKKIFKQ